MNYRRFTVTSIRTTNDDIIKDWTEIRLVTTELLKELNIRIADRAKVPLKGKCFKKLFDYWQHQYQILLYFFKKMHSLENDFLPLNFLVDTREKNEAFGSSLLLANSPMSPKIVNGSFAAIFDADEFLAKAYAGIRATVSHFFWHFSFRFFIISSVSGLLFLLISTILCSF